MRSTITKTNAEDIIILLEESTERTQFRHRLLLQTWEQQPPQQKTVFVSATTSIAIQGSSLLRLVWLISGARAEVHALCTARWTELPRQIQTNTRGDTSLLDITVQQIYPLVLDTSEGFRLQRQHQHQATDSTNFNLLSLLSNPDWEQWVSSLLFFVSSRLTVCWFVSQSNYETESF